MKKIFTLIRVFIFGLITQVAISQPVIPNGNFESWNTFGIPTSWYGFGYGDRYMQSSDAHSGTSALKLQNKAGSSTNISTSFKRTNANYPAKLKGFVKYTIPAGEKATITVRLGRRDSTSTQITTYLYDIGWARFTGNSNGYVPFEITLDYKLDDVTFFEKKDFNMYDVKISGFDERADISSSSPTITANSSILIDDLVFEGTSALSYTDGNITESFEDWGNMDGDVYPRTWINGLNVDDEFLKHATKSSDASVGTSALRISQTVPDETFNISKEFVNRDPSKKLSMMLKYNLGPHDTLSAFIIQSQFAVFEQAFSIANASKTSYTEVLSNMSAFDKDSICFLFIQLKKGANSTTTPFALIDDIKMVSATGLNDEVTLPKSLTVSPNPSTTGNFKVNNISGDKFEILDVRGQVINNVPLQMGEEDVLINLSNYPRGIYFLKDSKGRIARLVY